MYKTKILLFFVILLNNVSFASNIENLSSDADVIIQLEDVAYLSELWPRFVRIKQPFEVPGSETVLKAQTRGVLMRIEGNHAVIDFGGNGTHKLHINEVDLISQMKKLLDSDKPTRTSLFHKRMFNKFFKNKNGKCIQTGIDDFRTPRYCLLLYADLRTDESEAVVSWLLKKTDLMAELACVPLLFPMDSTEKELLSDVRELAWTYPSLYHWSYKAHAKSLSYDGITNPSIILIDDSGRTVSRGNDVKFLKSVASLIRKDTEKADELRKKYNL